MRLARWYHSIVRTRPDLYRAIYDFNAYPHRWAHASWLETPALEALEQHAHTRRRLSTHYRSHFGLAEAHWDFTAPRTRLALLPTATLARLAYTVGAVEHASRLARVITRDERRALIDTIGEATFTYALRRSRVLSTPRASASESPRNTTLVEDILSTGWQTQAAALATEPDAVQQRFRLKLPRAFSLVAAESDTDAANHAWAVIHPIAQETLTTEELRCLA